MPKKIMLEKCKHFEFAHLRFNFPSPQCLNGALRYWVYVIFTLQVTLMQLFDLSIYINVENRRSDFNKLGALVYIHTLLDATF